MPFDDMYHGQELYMQALAIKIDLFRENDIRITEHCFYTDIEYIMYPCPFMKTVAYLNTCVYMYRVAVNEQSMSINGKRKHIDEQKKILNNVIDYYRDMKEKRVLSESQRRYFEVILNNMVKSHTTAILSLQRSRTNYKRMIEFNNKIKETVPDIYRLGNNSIFMKLIRRNSYAIYFIESVAYCLFCKIR